MRVADYVVALQLVEHFNEHDGGRAFAGYAHIAEETGLGKATVKRAITRLSDREHLLVILGKPGRGYPNQYWMALKLTVVSSEKRSTYVDHKEPEKRSTYVDHSGAGKGPPEPPKGPLEPEKRSTYVDQNHYRTTSNSSSVKTESDSTKDNADPADRRAALYRGRILEWCAQRGNANPAGQELIGAWYTSNFAVESVLDIMREQMATTGAASFSSLKWFDGKICDRLGQGRPQQPAAPAAIDPERLYACWVTKLDFRETHGHLGSNLNSPHACPPEIWTRWKAEREARGEKVRYTRAGQDTNPPPTPEEIARVLAMAAEFKARMADRRASAWR